MSKLKSKSDLTCGNPTFLNAWLALLSSPNLDQSSRLASATAGKKTLLRYKVLKNTNTSLQKCALNKDMLFRCVTGKNSVVHRSPLGRKHTENFALVGKVFIFFLAIMKKMVLQSARKKTTAFRREKSQWKKWKQPRPRRDLFTMENSRKILGKEFSRNLVTFRTEDSFIFWAQK